MRGSVVPWRLGHRPAVDGARGLAILLVLVGHALPQYGWRAGTVGVTLFFVLSGFLITSLLSEEVAATGRVDYRAFYERRIRRLLPAFAVVAVVTLASMVAIGQTDQGLFGTLAAASYVGNWVKAAGAQLGPFGHTWSLSVEEQFYLVWPLVVLIASLRLRASRQVWLLLGAAVAIEVARGLATLTGTPSERLYFGTDMQADGLLLGAALGIQMHRRPITLPYAARFVAIGLLGAVAFILPGDLFFTGIGNTIAALASLLLVASLVATPDRLFEFRWLTWVGAISYGLYLWHYPILWHLGVVKGPPYPGLGVSLLGVTLAVLAAVVSYRWVERPFRRPRRRALEPRPVDAKVVHPRPRSGERAFKL